MRNAILALALFAIASPAHAVVVPITFPVGGEYSFRNDFAEPRAGGARSHEGIDIIAAKMTPVVATVDGRIAFLMIPESSSGYSITLDGDDGYTYRYLHINNDTPGTDDGRGGEAHAYAPGLHRGSRVVKGQVLGWVGDSGNAESTVSHLHFEMHQGRRNAINPYDSLVAASNGRNSGTFESPPVTHAPEIALAEEAQFVAVRQLQEGSVSAEVAALHAELKTLGYYSGSGGDAYVAETREAIRKFQVAEGLQPTGIADGLTQRRLTDRAKLVPAQSTISTGTVTGELAQGASGQSVRDLQLRLKQAGFFTGEATGYFGPVTKSAIMAFQRSKGIPAIGIVGPQTRAALNLIAVSQPQASSAGLFTADLEPSMRSESVRALQALLARLGHFKGEATGYFGPQTKASVIAYQKAKGISGTGIVGPLTRAALNAE